MKSSLLDLCSINSVAFMAPWILYYNDVPIVMMNGILRLELGLIHVTDLVYNNM